MGDLILIRHLSMLPQAPRAWQTPTSWSIHSGMVLGSLHYAGFFDLTPPGVGGGAVGRQLSPFRRSAFVFSRDFVIVDKIKPHTYKE